MPGGFLTHHMAAHILAMNLVAPLVALLLPTLPRVWQPLASIWQAARSGGSGRSATATALPADSRSFHTRSSGPGFHWGRSIGVATAVQLALLWGWHAPGVFAAATGSAALMALMHLSLFAAAVWFWTTIIQATRRGDWSPLAALLVTGKLFCLLGLLLAFAPRALYASAAFIQSCFPTGIGFATSPPVADQQLAGLLMLTACPLVYVTAAIVIASRMLRRVARQGWTLAARAPD
jgi:putative membrane protein